MLWDHLGFDVLLVAAGGLSLLLSWRASARQVAGARAFAAMMLVAGTWAFVYVGLLATSDAPSKLLCYRLEWLGYALVPPMWLAFALELTGFGMSRKSLGALIAPAAVFVLLAWTNDTHHLMWAWAVPDAPPLPTLNVGRAAGAWVFFIYSYAELGLATGLLVRCLWRMRRLYRCQGAALLTGVLVPMVGNVAYTFGLGPLPNLDLTPFTFSITGVAFGFGLLRLRLLDLVPVAPRVAVRGVFESMADGILVVDREGRIIDLNPAVASILGVPQSRIMGEQIGGVLPGVTPETRGVATNLEFVRHDAETNAVRHYDVRLSPLRHWSGADAGCLVALRDVTDRRQAAEAVRASEQRLRALLRSVSDVITVLDSFGLLQYVSPACEATWGDEPARLVGQNIFDRLHTDDRGGLERALADARQQPGSTHTAAARLQLADASWRDFEVVVSDLTADPAVGGIIASWRDVTERISFEQELSRLAFQDATTGLPNRALFMDRLEHAYARAARLSTFGQGGDVAVLFIDLDNFKVVNDSVGHHVGDAVLVETAHRLRGCLRAGDTAARLGGDEFTVLLEGVASLDDAVAAAERIVNALRAPISIAGREVFLGTSIGIALSGPGRQRPADLLRCADMAMYEAKRRGKGRYEVFDERTLGRLSDRLDLETDLRHAIERGEFRVHFQPIIDLASDRIVEVEALARWEHPRRGNVPPDRFIPVCEEIGLIVPIGQWVLERACEQAVQWRRTHHNAGRLVVSVNLSARQFQHPDLVADISRTLSQTGLDPRCLKLEITESVVMQDAAAAVETLQALKALGIQLAIDDFGTGYSSLSYLKTLPFDTLKIDRSFVDGLGQDPQDTGIVHSIIALARTLNLSVTAEGVETLAQHQHLVRLGCDRGQGYLFARPMPASEIDTLLVSRVGAASARAA